MDGMFVFSMSIIVTAFCILWLYVGSRSSLDCYKTYIEKGEEPKPDGFSFSFSSGAAYVFLFLGFSSPIIYLLESNGIVSMNMFVGTFLLQIILIGTFLTFFVIFATACEWLLRKMARCKEPEIQFDRWLWLK